MVIELLNTERWNKNEKFLNCVLKIPFEPSASGARQTPPSWWPSRNSFYPRLVFCFYFFLFESASNSLLRLIVAFIFFVLFSSWVSLELRIWIGKRNFLILSFASPFKKFFVFFFCFESFNVLLRLLSSWIINFSDNIRPRFFDWF